MSPDPDPDPGLSTRGISGGAAKAANVFWDWGLPLAALGIGYVMGDFLGIANVVNNVTKGKIPNLGTISSVGLLTAGIFTAVAVALWRGIGGMVGRLLGFFFLGVALNLLVSSLGVSTATG